MEREAVDRTEIFFGARPGTLHNSTRVPIGD